MRVISWLLASLVSLVCLACSGEGQQVEPRDALYAERQLAQLDSLPCPAGCDPATWAALKESLRMMLTDGGRAAAQAPTGAGSRAVMQLDITDHADGWHYACQGDYNQDGEVGISDLTPLGVNFLDTTGDGSPFPFLSALSVIDGDGNGELNLADLTPLGMNFGARVTGYNVYSTDDEGQVPLDGGPSTLAPATLAPFASATGDPTVDRLFFPWPEGVSHDHDYSFVRPVDSGDGTEGRMSTIAWEDIDLDLVDPPAEGDGTLGNPYVLGNDADFALVVTLQFTGDVTGSPNLSYTVNPPEAAEITGNILHVGSGAQNFLITAGWSDYAGDPEVDNSAPLYLRKGPPDADPVISLTATPDSGPRPLQVTLDASGTTDDGTIVKYQWDLDGDGTFELDSATNTSIQHTFLSSGELHPAVRVTDDGGNAPELSQTVTIDGSWHITTVDDSSDFVDPSLGVVEGFPAIAYTDNSADKLVYVRATDADGINWGSPVMPDPVNPLGFLPSLLIADGHPAVVYQGQPPANICGYIRALDPAGSTWGAATTFTFASNGVCGAIVDGRPALAYNDQADGRLRYLRAADASGSLWPVTPVDVDAASTLDGQPSLAVIGGVPALTYKDTVSVALRYCRSSDSAGAAWEASVVADGDAGNSVHTSLMELAGVPVFASNIGFAAQFHRAQDAQGSAWNPFEPVTQGFMPLRLSLAQTAGLPMMAFCQANDDVVRFAIASDSTGELWGGEVVETSADVPPDCAEINGQPAVVYSGVNGGELKYAVYF